MAGDRVRGPPDLKQERRPPGKRAANLEIRGNSVNSKLSEAELRACARAKGYRRGWVWHRLQEQRRTAT
jgi:hypothetical protein